MAKYKYVIEFELAGSPKLLYPYLQNPANLQEWFANKVVSDSNKIINFVWDNSNHYAKVTHNQLYKYIRYEFLDEQKQEVKNDPSYLEFRLLQSELTKATFLRVVDYSEMTNEKDLHDLWTGLIEQLKDVAGV
jgi:uncharacterized protein YndB with AHSA1/START domain